MDRFWSKTEQDKQCIVWTGALDGHGYGCFRYEGRSVLAHRVSWKLFTGSWPDQCLCHSCDNPRCVNVEHLFEGTRGDNNRDKAAKGRHPNSLKRFCPKGHSLTKRGNQRICKICQNEASKRYKERKR
jgi:hypothetical protein